MLLISGLIQENKCIFLILVCLFYSFSFIYRIIFKTIDFTTILFSIFIQFLFFILCIYVLIVSTKNLSNLNLHLLWFITKYKIVTYLHLLKGVNMYLIVYLKILFCFLCGPQDDLHYGISPYIIMNDMKQQNPVLRH